MSSTKKRIRVFAGPNGSGKTTIMTDLRNRIPFGVYVNADDIEKELHENGSVDLSQYSLAVTTLEIQHYFTNIALRSLTLANSSRGVSFFFFPFLYQIYQLVNMFIFANSETIT
jgi:predicted ATP-binding protein involved in virulence